MKLCGGGGCVCRGVQARWVRGGVQGWVGARLRLGFRLKIMLGVRACQQWIGQAPNHAPPLHNPPACTLAAPSLHAPLLLSPCMHPARTSGSCSANTSTKSWKGVAMSITSHEAKASVARNSWQYMQQRPGNIPACPRCLFCVAACCCMMLYRYVSLYVAVGYVVMLNML